MGNLVIYFVKDLIMLSNNFIKIPKV